LTRDVADVSGLTVDVALNVVEFADPVERLAGDLGLCRCPKIVEVAPQMSPTSCFAQTRDTTRFRLVEFGITFVAVGLQNTARVSQVAQDVLFLPVRCEPIDSTGWRCPGPWSLVTYIGPDPALFDPFAKPLVAS